MTRRAAMALLAGCAACARREPSPDPFPDTVAAWKLASLREIPVAEAPDSVPKESVRRALAAAYEGPGKLEARAYELTRQEIGLDIAQRWRAAPDTIFFWARSWFVIVHWRDADRKALQDFTRELEKRLNAP
jgi:hypothetical protein